MKQSRKTRSLGRSKRHLRVRKRISGTNERPRVSLYRSNKSMWWPDSWALSINVSLIAALNELSS